MKLLISSIIFFTIGMVAFGAKAEPNRASSGMQSHAPEAVDEGWGATFVEEAFANARMFSPFAEINAPQGAKAETIVADAKSLLDYAAGFLGTRYRLGAAGPKAFDCSGFTSYVFRHAAGVEITRTSRSQFTQGQNVERDDLRPGDLLFFSSRSSGRNNVGHVGIVSDVDPLTGAVRFIHASTKKGVTYGNFPDDGYYSRHYIGAKRILE